MQNLLQEYNILIEYRQVWHIGPIGEENNRGNRIYNAQVLKWQMPSV